ncbi:universal stress protein [Streptomyces sp. NPDC056358]|uniref:universal stress protein n=1 Tax=Streptomyces sp. NPDC056358 TaxID=3345794 RepID=UPI0035DAE574
MRPQPSSGRRRHGRSTARRHGDRPPARTHGRILVGVKEPEGGSAAIRFAFREAEARDCALDAIHAWRCPPCNHADHPVLPVCGTSTGGNARPL